MCVAVLVKPGATVSEENMRRMFNCNRDGAGLAYVRTSGEKTDVVIDKGYFDSEEWIAAYKRAQQITRGESPILLHARIATMGKINKSNCHPFAIKNGALIHNGSLWYSIGYGIQCEKSDTREFAERCTNNLVYEDIMQDKESLERTLSGNKIVMLFKDKRYVILNEKSGIWQDDVWYSNSFFKNSSTAACHINTYSKGN